MAGLNLPILLTREPGGTQIGERVRHLLQHDPAGHNMTAEAELLLFTASRAQLTREVIVPALNSGTTVLADRFLDSTTVYQGVARAIPEDAVRFINNFAVGGTKPDITFVFDLDPAVARERILQRHAPSGEDRMEQQPAAFFDAVRHGYRALASREVDRVKLIDAAQPINQIEAQVWSHIEHRLPIPNGISR